jgi:hypothetical protein
MFQRHDDVALFDNRWLHLFALNNDGPDGMAICGQSAMVGNGRSGIPLFHGC